MSTSYALHCYTHDDSCEYGQSTPARDTLVDVLSSRDELIALSQTPIWASMDRIPFMYFYGYDILHWFIEHASCDVAIRDEYGYRYDHHGVQLEVRDV